MAQGRISQTEKQRREDEFKSSEPIIYQGASIEQLCKLFNVSGPTARARLARVKPCGRRDGNEIYLVSDAATVLVRMSNDDMIERILRMHADELPQKLSKAYWDGQNARLSYEERTGDLWDTKRVVEIAGEVFKTMRLSLMILPDTLEREASLSHGQRSIIERLIDELLDALRRKLISGFEDRREHKVGEPEPSGEDDPAEGL